MQVKSAAVTSGAFSGHHLCCANCGRLECGGSDVGKHDFHSEFRDGQQREHLCPGGGPATKATGPTSAIYYAKRLLPVA